MKTRRKERRRYTRHALTCPVTLYDDRDEMPLMIAMGNLSDGGMYLAVPAQAAPKGHTRKWPANVDLTFCVPRSPEKLDVFSIRACVTRCETTRDDSVCGIGMRFKKPIDLSLG